MYRHASEILKNTLGNDHPSVASSLSGLANLLSDKGDYEQAEPWCRQALEIYKKTLGNDYRDVGASFNNFANLLSDKGEYKKMLGNDHPSVAISLGNLARLLKNKGDYGQALEILNKTLENDNPNIADTQREKKVN